MPLHKMMYIIHTSVCWLVRLPQMPQMPQMSRLPPLVRRLGSPPKVIAPPYVCNCEYD